MPTTDSSIGIDQSVVTFGDQATVDADAAASATGSASSVDGIAVGAAVITNGTGADAAASVGVLIQRSPSALTPRSILMKSAWPMPMPPRSTSRTKLLVQALLLVLLESVLAICSLMRAAA